MVNLSSIPVTVDGVRLDTLAYSIETLDGRLNVAGVRGDNPVVPGQDGSIFVPNKSFSDGHMVLKMWVKGSDVDGAIPGGSSAMAEFRKNLELLTRLFSGRHDKLLDIRQTWPSGVIQYLAEVVQPYDMSATAVNPKAGFAVELNLPGVFGQDVTTTDYSSAAALTTGTVLTLSAYNGGTAPINDAILVVKGPATNPRITNTDTGEWVQLNATIATGTDWRVDCGIWDTRTGSALGLAGAGGTNQVVNTQYAGGGAQFMRLSPKSGGPQITLSGSGFGAGTQVLARARRKFLT
jgi:hypothetical protein